MLRLTPKNWLLVLFLALATLVLLSSITGCSTAKKIERAKDMLNSHPIEAARFCADKYPVRSDTTVSIDSSGWEETFMELMQFSDSVLQESEAKNNAISMLNAYIDKMEASGRYDAQLISELRANAGTVRRTDVRTLRAKIEAEIRAKVKPCKDSIIRQENTAKSDLWAQYYGQEVKRRMLGDAEIKKLKGQLKWLWIILVGIGIIAVVVIYFRIRTGAIRGAIKTVTP